MLQVENMISIVRQALSSKLHKKAAATFHIPLFLSSIIVTCSHFFRPPPHHGVHAVVSLFLSAVQVWEFCFEFTTLYAQSFCVCGNAEMFWLDFLFCELTMIWINASKSCTQCHGPRPGLDSEDSETKVMAPAMKKPTPMRARFIERTLYTKW